MKTLRAERWLIPGFLSFLLFNCKTPDENKTNPAQERAAQYLMSYNEEFQQLSTIANEKSWNLNTKIVEGDTITQKEFEDANNAFLTFAGSQANIDSARNFLAIKDQLTPLQTKQLQQILFQAGGSPATAADAVRELTKTNAEQTKVLFGFDFKIDGKSVTKNDINNILSTSSKLPERLKAWTASKEVGVPLKQGLVKLRDLRNQTVQALGYSDFFSYQVSEYGMTKDEMVAMSEGFIKDIWPLYRELHTWARYELAKKYNQKVPDYLPAHWVTNQWGQDWTAMVSVSGLNLDDTLKTKTPEWIIKKGEQFYMSLGFPALPESFYEKSSLYPLPADAPYKKNNHASAWHIDYDKDVRSLMSVEANTEWWETTLHELGHIYYYISYSTPEVPIILRGGANRAYHEAIGTQIGLASLQKPLLESVNLIPKGTASNDTLKLLSDALQHIVVIPWGAGVMTQFEHSLYSENLSVNEFNKKWWELVRKYQGIEPPSARDEKFCDACSKTHIIDDAAQYYDYTFAEILLFQFHDHIASNILKQDVHATNYWGSKETGDFLKKLMSTGATIDWREHLKSTIGTDVSAKPLLNYFTPLMAWLQKQNKGRKHTLPASL
jgi:peptidyl-dipeptidase A